MKKALTTISVERAKPPASGQIEIFDKGYPGLSLRVSYGGGKAWGIHYRLKGKLRRKTLGFYPSTTLAEAREAWREVRRLVALGQDPNPRTIRTRDTVANVVADWIKRDKLDARPATIYQIESALRKHVLPAWGGREIRSITKREIHELLDGIVDSGATGAVQGIHAHLRSLFRWAVGREILPVDPMAGVKCPVKATWRERALSDAELVKVWRASDDDAYGPMLKLLILTACRREEITQLRWAEIQGDQIELPAERTKTDEPRVIPLSRKSVSIIANVGKPDGPYVFGAPKGWARAKARIDAATGINEPWTIHDLRRTAATGMQKLGVQLQVVEAILGHVGTRAGIVGVYQKYDYSDEKRAALEAWGEHVASIIGRQP